jgi:DNA processing protein
VSVLARDAEEEIRLVLALLLVPGLGPIRVSRLLKRFDTIEAVLQAVQHGRATLPGERKLPAELASRVRSADMGARVDAVLCILEGLEARVLLRGDPRLPVRFEELAEPPALVFVQGRLDLLDAGRTRIAVVGTRIPTEYGQDAARLFGEGLAARRVVVVSGLARGIDGIAHAAALAAGGGTIGVLGCGLDVSYPPENRRLQARLAREGLVVSEYLPGVGPRKHHFRFRNRLIAALSTGVVVVEGGIHSGALLTAKEALNLGIDVFGVPGPIGRPSHVGVNELIRDGAHLAMDADWVAEACGVDLSAPIECGGADPTRPVPDSDAATSPMAGPLRQIWSALDSDGRHVDEVARVAGLPAAQALVGLLELEVSGRARRLPGSRFALPSTVHPRGLRGTTTL